MKYDDDREIFKMAKLEYGLKVINEETESVKEEEEEEEAAIDPQDEADAALETLDLKEMSNEAKVDLIDLIIDAIQNDAESDDEFSENIKAILKIVEGYEVKEDDADTEDSDEDPEDVDDEAEAEEPVEDELQ